MAGWSTTKTNSSREKPPQLKDEVDLMEFPAGVYKPVRLRGPINSYMWSWNEYTNTKEPGKTNKFPKICLDYDASTGEYARDVCPYRKAGLYFAQRFVSNVIDRDLQAEGKPKKARDPSDKELTPRKMFGEKFNIKDKDSKSYTVYRVWDMPSGAKDKIVALTDLWHKRRIKANKGRKLPRVELSDPEFGSDILVKFNPEAKGAAMWDVQLDEGVPLKKSELKGLMYDIEHLKSIEPETLEVAKKEWKDLSKRLVVRDKDGKIIKKSKEDEIDDEDDDEDLEDKPKNKKKKFKKEDEDDDVPFKGGKKVKKDKSSKSEKSEKSSKLSEKAKKKKKLAKSLDDDLDDLD